MSAEETAPWPEAYGVTSRPASALADEYESLEALLEAYRTGADITDVSGVGRKSASKLRRHIESEYPDVVKERREQDEGICTEFTTDHGLDEEHLEEDTFYWGFVCPRCGDTTPLQGDPSGFGDRPYACGNCRWVSLLLGDAVAAFRDEHYDDDDSGWGEA
jgi:predicted RNA-binding Zn-ribbon protein involved in translation (DUF1610 family)